MQGALWLGLSLLIFGLSAVHPSQAATATYQWRTLDVGIELEPSGDLLVTETQSYDVHGQNPAPKLQRTIPLANIDRITDVEVFEGDRALKVKAGVKQEQFHIRWRPLHQPSPPMPEPRTFVVRYRVTGSVRLHPDGDQIVWTALFGERNSTLPNGSVTLRVPPDLAGEIQDSRSYGVPAEVRQLDSRTLSFTPNTALQPAQTLKVKVVVPPGRLQATMPDWQQGIDTPYVLPGILGKIDAIALIVAGIGLFAGLFYAISWTTSDDVDEIDPTPGPDRYNENYQQMLDRVTQHENSRTEGRERYFG